MIRPDGLFIYREIEAGHEYRPVYYWAYSHAPLTPVSPEYDDLSAIGLWWHEQKALDRPELHLLAVHTVRRLSLGMYSDGVLNLRWNRDEKVGNP